MRTNSAFRSIADTRPAQHAIQTVRAARTLTPAPAFIARQALHRTGTYKLKRTGANITVRHRTRDVAILAEIFARGSYTPPITINGPVRILDLGGNIGLFALYALATWDVQTVRSYEPDPDNAQLLAKTARPHPEWTVTQAAVSNTSGVMRFAAGQYSDSRAATPDEPAITVPVLDVYTEPRADLVKIDIEGGEWPILHDPRLHALASTIVLEWHSRNCPNRDAHGTAKRLLASAGYVHQRDADHEHDGNGVLWAWKN